MKKETMRLKTRTAGKEITAKQSAFGLVQVAAELKSM